MKGDDLLGTSIVSTLGGVGFFIIGYFMKSKYKQMVMDSNLVRNQENTPIENLTTQSINKYVKISGKTFTGTPLKSPYTETDCIYCDSKKIEVFETKEIIRKEEKISTETEGRQFNSKLKSKKGKFLDRKR
jgi:hypothetical protein